MTRAPRDAVRDAVGHAARLARVERWGRRDSWVAVLFHHVTEASSSASTDAFTDGLAVGIPLEAFRGAIRDLARDFEVVTIAEALSGGRRRPGGRMRAVICFDDAYASVGALAAPVLREQGLPWAFFVNPGLLDGRALMLDNFLAYTANTLGLGAVSQALGTRVTSVADAVERVVSRMPLVARASLTSRLEAAVGADGSSLARDAGIYLTTSDLERLAAGGVTIGNHTRDHVHCRALTAPDLEAQIGGSATELRRLTGQAVRYFAYPYGSRVDATPAACAAIANAGHECAFLVHGRLNRRSGDRRGLYRVSLDGVTRPQQALELRVLPRLRGLRRPRRGAEHL